MLLRAYYVRVWTAKCHVKTLYNNAVGKINVVKTGSTRQSIQGSFNMPNELYVMLGFCMWHLLSVVLHF
jgi:hypothetical protein